MGVPAIPRVATRGMQRSEIDTLPSPCVFGIVSEKGFRHSAFARPRFCLQEVRFVGRSFEVADIVVSTVCQG